jgi:hypothetical protein
MPASVRVLADSLSPTGDRLTTIEATYERYIHSELLTHRELSRSSASSRAIPVAKMLARIEEDPVVPVWWGKNQGGMQAYEEVADKDAAEKWWREGLKMMVAHARAGAEMNLHKQIVNRVTEAGMWITVIASSTSWSNFLGLRDHHAAEPHFQRLAKLVRNALDMSKPKELRAGRWHMPLIYEEDWPLAAEILGHTSVAGALVHDKFQVENLLARVSVGRCARVSYLTHDGKRDLKEDLALHDKLIVQEPLHASPGEHVAMALDWPVWFKKDYPVQARKSSEELNYERFKARERQELAGDITPKEIAFEAALTQIQSGNFRGWKQFRKLHKNEYIGEPKP